MGLVEPVAIPGVRDAGYSHVTRLENTKNNEPVLSLSDYYELNEPVNVNFEEPGDFVAFALGAEIINNNGAEIIKLLSLEIRDAAAPASTPKLMDFFNMKSHYRAFFNVSNKIENVRLNSFGLNYNPYQGSASYIYFKSLIDGNIVRDMYLGNFYKSTDAFHWYLKMTYLAKNTAGNYEFDFEYCVENFIQGEDHDIVTEYVEYMTSDYEMHTKRYACTKHGNNNGNSGTAEFLKKNIVMNTKNIGLKIKIGPHIRKTSSGSDYAPDVPSHGIDILNTDPAWLAKLPILPKFRLSWLGIIQDLQNSGHDNKYDTYDSNCYNTIFPSICSKCDTSYPILKQVDGITRSVCDPTFDDFRYGALSDLSFIIFCDKNLHYVDKENKICFLCNPNCLQGCHGPDPRKCSI